MTHRPVLKKEVIEYLDPRPNQNFVDCTFGQGGHAQAIMRNNEPDGKLLAIEQTSELVKQAKERMGGRELGQRLILVNDNFVNLKEIVNKKDFGPVSGILLDLGFSLWHIKHSGLGFSFQKEEPLIMRYDGDRNKITAEEVVNTWPQQDIVRILEQYGEEKFAREIADKISQRRRVEKIRTTTQLSEIIKEATPSWYHKKRIHPATRTFQALRIAVNQELENLETVLPQTTEVLEQEGRLVVISFHSLEDRIVKNFFKKSPLKIITRKPVRPGEKEIKENPSSRSAKLRAAVKTKQENDQG